MIARFAFVSLCCLTALGCQPASTSQPTEEVPATSIQTADQKAAHTESPHAELPPQAAAENKQDSQEQSTMKPVATETPLIPRDVLFGNPDKAMARLSPDGKRLSYLAPVRGVLNVFVGPVDDPEAAKPVTADKKRGIRNYFWAYTSNHILYTQDTGGDENWRVYSVDLTSGEIKDLTPIDNVRAEIQEVSDRFPETILVGLNDRDPQYHDLYRVNIGTGDRELVQKNDQFAGFVTDDDYRVRFATKMTDDGGEAIYEPDGKGGWKEWQKIGMADTLTTSPAGFDKSGKILYFMDSRGRDTGALVAVDLGTGETKMIAENDKADIGGVLSHPTEKTIEGVSFNYERVKWTIFDPEIKKDFEYLNTVADGELTIASRTLDDKTWIVAYLMDDGPVRYYLYHRPEKKTTFLFTNRKSLEGLPLVKMHPVVIPSRDGLNLVSYLTLPKYADTDGDARPDKPLPLVLTVHGGPWARDDWGFDPQAQLLSNRGYATLSVNFRGSTGFGKSFANAGNKEWAGKMHNDLLDAVAWAVKEKIADPEKVAIMGGSYGGYATLVGLTFTPEAFACGVDVVGPSNLFTLLKTIPPYWAPAIQMFKDRVGDLDTEEGRKLLEERSPLNFVDRIQRPLLIGQGANDPRVKQSEADQIVAAMTAKKIPVTYVLFPDEGHGFARPENSLAFNAVTELFLAEHLGGRYEPIGNDFEGSSIKVPIGGSDLPGLEKALKK
jgi:dipeptidyl aminopeptidase/acylaminoacyl peptidase